MIPGLPSDHAVRLGRVRMALDGLSLGEAFGGQFSGEPSAVAALVASRSVPPPPWRVAGESLLALAMAQVLNARGFVEQDELARAFGYYAQRHPDRGFSASAAALAATLTQGVSWKDVASSPAGAPQGDGSGAAVRAPILGAYFAEDEMTLLRETRAAAELTHPHPEGLAGAIAVAVATSAAYAVRERADAPRKLFEQVLDATPPSRTRRALEAARRLPFDATAASASKALGSGQHWLASDTVPFAVWCASRYYGSFENAVWAAAEGLGDVRGCCAIVGGIVSMQPGRNGIPPGWLSARERLPRV